MALGASALAFPSVLRAANSVTLGHGDFRYRVVPGWGVLGAETPVKNCHGIVCDSEGNIVLLTDEIKNNFIIYDASGKLVHKWGTKFPGAHGLSLVKEGSKEVLYFTDRDLHKVYKATLSGDILEEWAYPEKSGKYAKEAQYKPAWTLHHPDGGFYVLDGYGRDYITHYDAKGKYAGVFGGQEGGIPHWGPHGGILETGKDGKASLLIAMSDQQNLLRLDTQGRKLASIPLPGGNPRQIQKHGDYYYVAHLADNWPADRDSRGFVSILDSDFRVVSNIAGNVPVYDDDGNLQKMKSTTETFIHPHDLTIGKDGSVYVAQFLSGNTYPVKLERV
ncbi:MAG: 6-bladed beta-propeller [Akkermansiaceae bacterium]